jgi:hypothetical protein
MDQIVCLLDLIEVVTQARAPCELCQNHWSYDAGPPTQIAILLLFITSF